MPQRVTTSYVEPEVHFSHDDLPEAVQRSWSKPYTEVPDEFWPLRFVQKHNDNAFRDFMAPPLDTPTIIVSAAARALIEELEPGVHQFVPLVLVHRDGREEPEGAYFLFKVLYVIEDGVVPELSDVKRAVIPGLPGAWNYSLPVSGKVTFRQDALGNAHAWSTQTLSYDIFFSDALIERIEAAGMKGLRSLAPAYLADAPVGAARRELSSGPGAAPTSSSKH